MQRLVNLTTQLFFEMFLFLNCDKFDWIEDLKFLFEWIKCIINFEFSYWVTSFRFFISLNFKFIITNKNLIEISIERIY